MWSQKGDKKRSDMEKEGGEICVEECRDCVEENGLLRWIKVEEVVHGRSGSMENEE